MLNYEKLPGTFTSHILILHDDRQPRLDSVIVKTFLSFLKRVSFSFVDEIVIEMEY